jgi:protein gp37
VFVNSMSDLFHDQVPAEFIAQVFAVAAVTGQHTYQILTKRHARMRWLLNSEHFLHQLAFEIADLSGRRWPDDVPWPLPNVWLGVSVEDQKRADLRIPSLIRTPAKVRWLSCEPLLGPVDLTQVASGERADLKLDVVRRHQFSLDGSWSRDIPGGIDWVVAGGESGPGARPMHPSWVRKLLRQCEDNRVPFFFKQAGAWTWSVRPGDAWYDRDPDAWVSVTAGRVVDDGAAQADGGDFQGVWKVGKKAAGRQIDGITHDGYPEARR